MSYPNRWTTPITLEIKTGTAPSRFKNFADLQLAYLWVKDLSLAHPQEWELANFEETCEGLDTAYATDGLRGYYEMAETFGTLYIVYYGVLTL